MVTPTTPLGPEVSRGDQLSRAYFSLFQPPDFSPAPHLILEILFSPLRARFLSSYSPGKKEVLGRTSWGHLSSQLPPHYPC